MKFIEIWPEIVIFRSISSDLLVDIMGSILTLPFISTAFTRESPNALSEAFPTLLISYHHHHHHHHPIFIYFRQDPFDQIWLLLYWDVFVGIEIFLNIHAILNFNEVRIFTSIGSDQILRELANVRHQMGLSDPTEMQNATDFHEVRIFTSIGSDRILSKRYVYSMLTPSSSIWRLALSIRSGSTFSETNSSIDRGGAWTSVIGTESKRWICRVSLFTSLWRHKTGSHEPRSGL